MEHFSKNILLIFAAIGSVLGQTDYETKFAPTTEVTLLKNSNFDDLTHLGIEKQYAGTTPPSKPWNCAPCKRLVPIWEKLEEKYRGKINIGAVNGEANLDIRDRFVIYHYPSAVFFSTDNKMYYFEDYFTDENLYSYLDQEKWRKQEAQDIPTEISYVKVYYHKIMSPVMIPVIVVVVFVVLIIVVCVQDRTYEKQKREEARRIKQSFIEKKYKSKESKESPEEASSFIRDQRRASAEKQLKSPVELYQSSLDLRDEDTDIQTISKPQSQEIEIELTNL